MTAKRRPKGPSFTLRLQDARTWGEELDTLADWSADGFDAHDAFLAVPFGEGTSLVVGRQEIALDNQRLVGNVGWSTQGRSFDGVRFAHVAGTWRATAFGVVLSPDGKSLFGGAHLGLDVAEGHTVSAVALGRTLDPDTRHTVGINAKGAALGVNYLLEGYYQLGEEAKERVGAWMGAANVGYAVDNALRPGLSLRAEALSGDGTPQGTFDTLYATNHKFYGEMDFFLAIGPHTAFLGLVDVGGQVSLEPTREAKLSVDVHHFTTTEPDANDATALGDEIDAKILVKLGKGLELDARTASTCRVRPRGPSAALPSRTCAPSMCSSSPPTSRSDRSRAISRLFPALFPLLAACFDAQPEMPPPNTVTGKCMTCHKEESPGLYRQWDSSEHGKHGVTCIDCHGAEKTDVDAFEHEGAWIATLVTPKDCGDCHSAEAEEVSNSYHATAGEILESADAYLAHAAGGEPAAIAGCESCHGARIEIDPEAENKLAAKTWPNTGIGRLNPDGSKGSCTACHSRHTFSIAQARRPEACSKCHLGPDHPQKEVYEESKHGNAFFTNVDQMNLDADRWVVGIDYSVAPTCATCHMSATVKQPVTHDVGKRISRTLRPELSKHKEDWEAKRENMQDVCQSCHAEGWVDGFYTQYDGLVNLYNVKFAEPAGEIMAIVRKKGLLEHEASFSNEIEWIYWELWHHEGRRARHGAAMMGPDYTWWHGIYDVAHNFYFEFLPAAREYHDPDVDAAIDKLLKDDPMHAWLSRDTAAIKADIKSGKLQEAYKDLYRP